MTQEEKIIREMLRQPQKEWFYPPDFMRGGDLFVGYEASARLSGLAKKYPRMIESRRNGKYTERRICYEAVGVWWEDIPEGLQAAFADAGIGPAKIITV